MHERDPVLARAAADPATSTLVRSLADLVYAGDTYEAVFAESCDLAPRLISGCDHVSLMLAKREGFETAAASDEVARHVDSLERALGTGPCVDAITDEAHQLDPDITQASRWPMLAARIIAETPVRGMTAFRILVGGSKVGALNLFSDTAGAFSAATAAQGAVFASFVSVALTASHDRQQASTLRDGLQSNREIGKAVGLLMAGHKVDSDEAFAMLRRASQDMRMKLVDVAREVVDHHDSR